MIFLAATCLLGATVVAGQDAGAPARNASQASPPRAMMHMDANAGSGKTARTASDLQDLPFSGSFTKTIKFSAAAGVDSRVMTQFCTVMKVDADNSTVKMNFNFDALVYGNNVCPSPRWPPAFTVGSADAVAEVDMSVDLVYFTETKALITILPTNVTIKDVSGGESLSVEAFCQKYGTDFFKQVRALLNIEQQRTPTTWAAVAKDVAGAELVYDKGWRQGQWKYGQPVTRSRANRDASTNTDITHTSPANALGAAPLSGSFSKTLLFTPPNGVDRSVTKRLCSLLKVDFDDDTGMNMRFSFNALVDDCLDEACRDSCPSPRWPGLRSADADAVAEIDMATQLIYHSDEFALVRLSPASVATIDSTGRKSVPTTDFVEKYGGALFLGVTVVFNVTQVANNTPSSVVTDVAGAEIDYEQNGYWRQGAWKYGIPVRTGRNFPQAGVGSQNVTTTYMPGGGAYDYKRQDGSNQLSSDGAHALTGDTGIGEAGPLDSLRNTLNSLLDVVIALTEA